MDYLFLIAVLGFIRNKYCEPRDAFGPRNLNAGLCKPQKVRTYHRRLDEPQTRRPRAEFRRAEAALAEGESRHKMTRLRPSVMSIKDQLTELESLAQRMEVRVSYEAMSGLVQGIGGLCKVKGEYRIIIDRRLKTPERVQIIADALRRFPVPEGVDVSAPVLRLLADT